MAGDVVIRAGGLTKRYAGKLAVDEWNAPSSAMTAFTKRAPQ